MAVPGMVRSFSAKSMSVTGPYQIETGYVYVSGGDVGTAHVSGGDAGHGYTSGGDVGQVTG